METIKVETGKGQELIDITEKVRDGIGGMENGIIHLHVPHTTAAITINENADPYVKKDIIKGLSIFDRSDYEHGEMNSSAHIKSSLVGASLDVVVRNGSLVLGTWQGILFCEFDGPRHRKLYISKIISNA